MLNPKIMVPSITLMIYPLISTALSLIIHNLSLVTCLYCVFTLQFRICRRENNCSCNSLSSHSSELFLAASSLYALSFYILPAFLVLLLGIKLVLSHPNQVMAVYIRPRNIYEVMWLSTRKLESDCDWRKNVPKDFLPVNKVNWFSWIPLDSLKTTWLRFLKTFLAPPALLHRITTASLVPVCVFIECKMDGQFSHIRSITTAWW